MCVCDFSENRNEFWFDSLFLSKDLAISLVVRYFMDDHTTQLTLSMVGNVCLADNNYSSGFGVSNMLVKSPRTSRGNRVYGLDRAAFSNCHVDGQ